MATHTITIPHYVPTSDNVRAKSLRAWIRAKRFDRNMIACYALDVPKATGCRRVSVHLTQARGRLRDVQNMLKSCLDALVHCGVLKDDSYAYCRIGEPSIKRGATDETIILLEDV